MEDMLAKAQQAQGNAYAPYSNFHVGVCLRTQNQTLFTGCNVENASYGLTQCAEANAIGHMISAGEQVITEVLVITQGEDIVAPCGGCRQMINEFGNASTKIHLCNAAGYQQTVSLAALLPLAFGMENLVSGEGNV